MDVHSVQCITLIVETYALTPLTGRIDWLDQEHLTDEDHQKTLKLLTALLCFNAIHYLLYLEICVL